LFPPRFSSFAPPLALPELPRSSLPPEFPRCCELPRAGGREGRLPLFDGLLI
jgi:hypothetical protein